MKIFKTPQIPKISKILTHSSIKDFVKRFLRGLLRDFLRVSAVFIVLFIFIMLHLTKTVDVKPLAWLLDRDRNTQIQETSDSKNKLDGSSNLAPKAE